MYLCRVPSSTPRVRLTSLEGKGGRGAERWKRGGEGESAPVQPLPLSTCYLFTILRKVSVVIPTVASAGIHKLVSTCAVQVKQYINYEYFTFSTATTTTTADPPSLAPEISYGHNTLHLSARLHGEVTLAIP